MIDREEWASNKKKALIHRRDHLYNVLERTKTSNVHDRNGARNLLYNLMWLDESYEYPSDDWKLLRMSCENAEAFLYRVAQGYAGH